AELPKDADGQTALAAVRFEPRGLPLRKPASLSVAVRGAKDVPLLLTLASTINDSHGQAEIFQDQDVVRLTNEILDLSDAAVVPGLFRFHLFPDADMPVGVIVPVGAAMVPTGKTTYRIGEDTLQVTGQSPARGQAQVTGPFTAGDRGQ